MSQQQRPLGPVGAGQMGGFQGLWAGEEWSLTGVGFLGTSSGTDTPVDGQETGVWYASRGRGLWCVNYVSIKL